MKQELLNSHREGQQLRLELPKSEKAATFAEAQEIATAALPAWTKAATAADKAARARRAEAEAERAKRNLALRQRQRQRQRQRHALEQKEKREAKRKERRRQKRKSKQEQKQKNRCVPCPALRPSVPFVIVLLASLKVLFWTAGPISASWRTIRRSAAGPRAALGGLMSVAGAISSAVCQRHTPKATGTCTRAPTRHQHCH